MMSLAMGAAVVLPYFPILGVSTMTRQTNRGSSMGATPMKDPMISVLEYPPGMGLLAVPVFPPIL